MEILVFERGKQASKVLKYFRTDETGLERRKKREEKRWIVKAAQKFLNDEFFTKNPLPKESEKAERTIKNAICPKFSIFSLKILAKV